MNDDVTTTETGRAPVAVSSSMALTEALPAGVVARREGRNLTLSWGWRRFTGAAMGAFAVFWNGMIWPQIVVGTIPGIFVLTHGGAGLFVAYVALANLLNKTRVEISFGHLSVRHGPLWWPGRVDLELADLVQFHVVSRLVKTKNGRRTAYDLVVDRKSGPRVTVVKDVSSMEKAHAVERAIEGHLGITDEPNVEREGW